MEEHPDSSEGTSEQLQNMLRLQYDPHDPALHLDARWAVYDHAIKPVDPLRLMYSMAVIHGLRPDATVADVGGNDTADLQRLRRWGHIGLMYCVDPATDPKGKYLQGYTVPVLGVPPLIPVQAPIESAPLPKGSIDLLLSKFMLYHLENPEVGLQVFNELLSDDGLLVVATSGEQNKRQHRFFEEIIAEALSARLGRQINPPPHFNDRFTAEKAGVVLPRHFQVIQTYNQVTHARFNRETIGVYAGSLISMMSAFQPQVEENDFWDVFLEVFDAITEDLMRGTGGTYDEPIFRRFDLCKKRPKTKTSSLGTIAIAA